MAGGRSLGVLTLDLVAKIGGYEQGLDRAEKEAKKRAAAIEAAFDGAFAAIGAGFATMATAGAAALAFVNQQAEGIANFQGLAEKIGDTASAVASLQTASTVSGVALETIATASVKLTDTLASSGQTADDAAKAFKAIGLSFEAIKSQSPVDQIESIAKALDNFADGSEKSAIAVALFGRAGADLIPFFNDLANGSERNVRLTDEQIAAADAYTKQVAHLQDELSKFVQQQSAALIPTLGQVVDLLAQLAKNEEVVSVVTATVKLAVDAFVVVLQTLVVVGSDVIFVFKQVGQEIGAMAAQAAALARLDFSGFKAISSAVTEDAARARKELDAFQAKVMSIGKTTASATQAAASTVIDTKPKITLPKFGGSSKGGKDAAKEALDSQLKDLDRAINAERDLMSSRNKMLELYNAQGLISIQDYYSQQKNIRDDALDAQNKAYDAEIAALQAYISKAPADKRVAAQEKLNETLDKQAKLNRDAGNAAIEAGIKQQNATKEYQSQLDELNAKLLELNGNLAQAASIRFDASNEKLRLRLQAEGNDVAIKQLDTLKQYTVVQAQLNQLQNKFSLAQADSQLAEEKIARDRENGTLGEIQSLVKLGEVRKAQLASYQAEYAKYQELVSSGATLTDEQALQLKRLQSQIDEVSSSLDPLAQKFNTLFADKAADAFGSIIDGSKSVKEAVNDMVSSIISDFVKMAAQDVFKSLFSGGGSATGGVGFNWGSILSGLFGGARALGGPVMPNSLYRVNEDGPELFQAANGSQYLMTGTDGGRVVANGGGTAITVNVAGNVTRETAVQLSNQIALRDRAAKRMR